MLSLWREEEKRQAELTTHTLPSVLRSAGRISMFRSRECPFILLLFFLSLLTRTLNGYLFSVPTSLPCTSYPWLSSLSCDCPTPLPSPTSAPSLPTRSAGRLEHLHTGPVKLEVRRLSLFTSYRFLRADSRTRRVAGFPLASFVSQPFNLLNNSQLGSCRSRSE